MNEAEIIKKIAEQKRQKAIDLNIAQDVEFLLFGQAKAKYWASWITRQPSLWVEKLFELLNFKSIQTFDEVDGDRSLDCKEYIFPDHKFTFKISGFRSSWWDSKDTTRYADLYMYYGDELVASFGLNENSDTYGDNLTTKVVSIDSFIEGDWVAKFKEFVANAKIFYLWEKDDSRRKAIAAEAIALKNKFGITDEEISNASTAIEKIVESETKVERGTPFEIDYDKFNEQPSADKTSGGIVTWIKANPRTSISIVAVAVVLLSLINS